MLRSFLEDVFSTSISVYIIQVFIQLIYVCEQYGSKIAKFLFCVEFYGDVYQVQSRSFAGSLHVEATYKTVEFVVVRHRHSCKKRGKAKPFVPSVCGV